MNRMACVWLPHFAAQVEAQRLGMTEACLAIVQDQRVLDVSTQAARQGVRIGDTVQQVAAQCPQAHIVEADRRQYQELWYQVLDALGFHSPAVEDARQGVAYVEAKGLGALYGDEQVWCQAIQQEILLRTSLVSRLGVAETRLAAWIAASSAPIPPGYALTQVTARSYLEALSLRWLPLDAETRRRLDVLGIRTMGQFARLSTPAISEQFGPDNLRFHRWSRGEDDGPLQAKKEQELQIILDFDFPENRQEVLVEAMQRAVLDKLQTVASYPLSWQRMILRVRCDEGDVWEKSLWVRADTDRALGYLDDLLAQAQGTGSGVTEIRLSLLGLEPSRGQQLDLFQHNRQRIQQQEMWQRLARKYPSGCVTRIRGPNLAAHLVSDRYRVEPYSP